ncbi:MAG TPA: glycosyltransferase family 2 protein, partial [Actinoplanes sp.]
SDDTLAEDTDLTMALTRAGWWVVYEESARAWTEAPATLRQLWTQRYRWSYGTMQAMWKHRHSLVERGPSGRFGRIGLPFLALFQVALPMLAPLIDVLALYGLFFYDQLLSAAAWCGMLALQFLTAIVAFRMDGERLRPILVLPLQQFIYRQLMYLVVIRSVLTALAGVRLRWQKLRRTGDVAVLHPPQETPVSSAS